MPALVGTGNLAPSWFLTKCPPFFFSSPPAEYPRPRGVKTEPPLPVSVRLSVPGEASSCLTKHPPVWFYPPPALSNTRRPAASKTDSRLPCGHPSVRPSVHPSTRPPVRSQRGFTTILFSFLHEDGNVGAANGGGRPQRQVAQPGAQETHRARLPRPLPEQRVLHPLLPALRRALHAEGGTDLKNIYAN